MKKLILCMSMMATMASAQDVFLRGNIVMTTTQLQPQGGDVYRGEVTLDDADVFLFSDKYVYFECPSTGYKSGNIRINGGHYTATFNLSTKAWSFEAPTDENRISAFGSSVCNGQGATDFKGYAWLYGQQLKERSDQGLSDHPFYVSGISIGGNNTQNLLDRYAEITRNYSKYVIIGLSLGNEGIHESTNKQQTLDQFSTNMQKIIQKIKADGKVPVVMNNYTRGDFTLDDYSYVKQMNLLIHQWDVASVNTLGAIDDGTGSGLRATSKLFQTSNRDDYAYTKMAGNSRPEAQSLLKEACIIDYSGFVNESERPEKICDDDEKTKWCDTNRSPNYLTFDQGSVRPVSRWHLLNAGSEMPAYITRTCILQGRSNDQKE